MDLNRIEVNYENEEIFMELTELEGMLDEIVKTG